MDISKSIDFLLENAGPVIRYRLQKDILNNLSKGEEENLLEQIYNTPHFKLLQTYIKPNGYIGRGMHSWDNWRGVKLHETPLQDGETAARLLSYYSIPKTHPFIVNYVAAMRNEDILCREFSYIPPEIPRFEHRFEGLNNGNCLMSLIYAMQAMLGFGDDFEDVREFQQISLKGFRRILEISSLDEITKINLNSKRPYNYPYIESDEFFPDTYTLAMLAYTQSWRTEDNIKLLTDSINHINAIMKPDNNMYVRINGKFYAPCFAFIKPFRPFSPDTIDSILYRRPLSEIAMLGVGENIHILKESIENIKHALSDDGILRMNFNLPHNKRYSPKKIEYPTAYVDVRLEPDYKNKSSLMCDLTFWAVELLHLCENK
ncbi:MAG: hypothetical protein GX129_11765 [Clostridiales bacterium]|jgi:hypothetical protein|nr:hypothetical protein [Clostridiales bacterium]